MKKFALSLILLLALFFVHVSLLDIGIVKGESTIYIRADGSVEGTDKIQRDGNIYTLTGNINGSITVGRDNITIDGNGYTLQAGTETYMNGMYLSGRRNVIVRNIQIKSFFYCIILDSSSNYNSIIGNNITDNYHGIYLVHSSNNTISGNNIKNRSVGIYILSSSNSTISGNNIKNHVEGIRLTSSSNNTISENNLTNNEICITLSSHSNYNSIIGNNITDNSIGISLWYSSNNLFFHNNFINNNKQVSIPESGYANLWDNGVEGNYWSDYEERYPNATEIDGSGTLDTPYVIDENNQDKYPLMDEGGKFEPYVSTFHLLFEDGSHKLLGNLSVELRITEPEKEIIHWICRLSLSSPRLDEYHEPYIDEVELFLAWFFIIHPWGPVEIPQPPPPPEKVTLHVDEEIILFEDLRNVSDAVEEPRVVSWFMEEKIKHHEWGSLILPTIRVYFSDGQEWEWAYEDNGTLPFKFWPEMDVNLSELSGKIETETITLTTVEKVNPLIITSVRLIVLASILVAVAVAAVFVKYRKRALFKLFSRSFQNRPEELLRLSLLLLL